MQKTGHLCVPSVTVRQEALAVSSCPHPQGKFPLDCDHGNSYERSEAQKHPGPPSLFTRAGLQ